MIFVVHFLEGTSNSSLGGCLVSTQLNGTVGT